MSVVKKVKKKNNSYKKFDQIDGSHPLKKVIPDGFIDYQARIRLGGKLVYFNFELAKEMGLIPKSHENKLNKELEKKIMETFSIQIINEYDLMHNRTFSDKLMKSGKYMATRYLQLQHEDKKGKTSGDGRSIWNGQISHQNKRWDISSCGTGGTKLSPATSKYNKFFETGDPSISYGCGYAEIDEGLATALLSHIYHANNKSTERSLAIIEFENDISINVRAHENLIRPSHLFLYLKQDDFKSLKSLLDFYIEYQSKNNSEWKNCPKNKSKYQFFLNKFCHTFAKLSANFEDEYIFCWLDWDGDNILMDGGIIDYGSIRQFGLYHSEYRYDDVERFSTSLPEQKNKAKYIVQTMAQAVEWIQSNNKPTLQGVSNHHILDDFEKEYELKKNENLLYRLGLSERKTKQTLKRAEKEVLEFKKIFSYFELAKSHRGRVKVSDGVTVDAIFSMRNFLRVFPQLFLHRGEELSHHELLEILKTEYADDKDLELTAYRKQKLSELQTKYLNLIQKVASIFQEKIHDTLINLIKRSIVINKSGRVTGDAISHIVNLILKERKNITVEDLFEIAKKLAAYQTLDPDIVSEHFEDNPKGIINEAINIFNEYRDGI